MFTGIVLGTGVLAALEPRGGDLRLRVRAEGVDLSAARIGDSIAVSGACLTAVEVDGEGFAADVSRETLDHTTLAGLGVGARVNLETAVTAATLLGGHVVSGHVDGVATVCSRAPDARSVRFVVEAPAPLARYVAPKGAVCLDGVSLTVNEVEGPRFGVNIVPHTLAVTTLGEWAPGTRVNLEVDVIARYVERLLEARADDPHAPDRGIG